MSTRPKSQSGKPATKTTRASQEYAKLQHETDVRIQHLRSVLKDVARVYVANVEQQLIEIADRINTASPKAKGKSILPGQFAHIIEVLDSVNIKHEKGRRKDLKKIEIIIDTIKSHIPIEEE